ncbi:hypothetical protein [Corynebacterium sp.]|uniref:hypothetical protein n=1 Tax=Corynebacterium sp. TaxID=1720 RepID=UPI0028AE3A29|nr:hypothetical protein [Corynebacterium sp.]
MITGDPVDSVRNLRETEGGDIAVLAGVIDQPTPTTHPVIAGTGRHLSDDTVPTTRLRLLNASSTSTGNAVLTYRLRPAD